MTDDNKQNNFTFIPSEIRTVLKEIQLLATKPDSSSEAFSRLEKVINSSSPDVLNGLKNSFNEIFPLFLPKKRKKLEDIFKAKFEIPKKTVVPRIEKLEISQIDVIKQEISIGKTDNAYDLLCDLIMASDKEYLIKNITVLDLLSSKLKPYDKKDINRLFTERTGSLLESKVTDNKSTLTISNENKISRQIPKSVRNDNATSQDESDTTIFGQDTESILEKIFLLMSRPDTIADAFELLRDSIKSFSVADLQKHKLKITDAANLFFPKKRRDLLRLYDGRFKSVDNTVWDVEYEELLSSIRKNASKRLSHEKSFSDLCDVIMTCNNETLLEYRFDIQEISLFLPGNLRMQIQGILDKRTGIKEDIYSDDTIDDEIIIDQKIDSIFHGKVLEEHKTGEEIIEESVFEPQSIASPSATEDIEDSGVNIPSHSARISYPIIHERFNFTEHAVTRTGQRGIVFDSIEMAFQYGRQEHTRGAVYYVIGRVEVEEYKNSVPEIIRHEGLHVVCSSEDGSILTVFKNKDLSAIKHKKKVYTKKRKFH